MKCVLILAFLLAIGLMFADGVHPNGTGTEDDPYLIESLDNLLWLSTTEEAWEFGLHYLQTADIDASDTENWNDGEGFVPIGSYLDSTPFRATYDGDNYQISNLS